jgi:hypothetical protein
MRVTHNAVFHPRIVNLISSACKAMRQEGNGDILLFCMMTIIESDWNKLL